MQVFDGLAQERPVVSAHYHLPHLLQPRLGRSGLEGFARHHLAQLNMTTADGAGSGRIMREIEFQSLGAAGA